MKVSAKLEVIAATLTPEESAFIDKRERVNEQMVNEEFGVNKGENDPF